MKGTTAFMVLSLLTRSRATWDDRQYEYPRPVTRDPGRQPESGAVEHPAPSRAAISPR